MSWKQEGEWGGLEVWANGDEVALVLVLSPREDALLAQARDEPYYPGGAWVEAQGELALALEAHLAGQGHAIEVWRGKRWEWELQRGGGS